MMDRKQAEKRFSAIKQEAQNWKPAWKDIQELIRPTRGYFDGQQPNSGKTIDHKKLLSGSAGLASRILAAGLTAGLTSPSRPWFKLGTPDPDLMEWGPVKEYLFKAEQVLYHVYSRSNIYGTFHSMYEEIGPFGTAAAIILNDYDKVIRGRSFTIGEYYLGQGANCSVNTFGREYSMTVGQLVEEFGEKNVSDQVRAMFKQGEVDKFIKVCHLIQPNYDRKPGREDNQNMAYTSMQWEEGASGDKYLRKSGFKRFRVLAPRWDLTTSADIYGKSPGWEALGDVKMLQVLQRDKLTALATHIKPPVVKDSSVGDVNMLPGGVTVANSSQPNAGARALYQIEPNMAAIQAVINETKQDIDKYFYADMFLMLANSDRRQVTAEEVARKYEEKLLMLGPVLDRLKGELHDPFIDMTFEDISNPALGLLPPPPQELQDSDLKVEYISILHQAQKMVQTRPIEQFSSFAGNLMAAFPEVKNKINAYEIIDVYGDALGVNPKIIKTDEEVAEIERAQQEAAAAQAQTEQAMNIVQGAKVLSDTKVGENSALDALMGGMGGAPA